MIKDGALIWVYEMVDNAYTPIPAKVLFPGEHSDGSVPYTTCHKKRANYYGHTYDWSERIPGSQPDIQKSVIHTGSIDNPDFTKDQLQELDQHTKNCYCETIELMRNGCGCGGR